jgi:SAM-dependent methyltransferase
MDQSTPDATGEAPAHELASLQGWHARYAQQAGWTRDVRRYLYQRANLAAAQRVLEVGCGTGVITADLSASCSASICGLDLHLASLKLAAQTGMTVPLACGDALSLPYASGTFDLTCCHFLLLWVPKPAMALAEMRRVTRRGGAVLILAEPDYGGRIDYPPELDAVGRWQREALARNGADSEIGRKLGALLAEAGLQMVELGVLGGQWGAPPSAEAQTLEWAVLRLDLQGVASPPLLQALQVRDRVAWQRGERVLYVPTFYAWGRVS